MPRFDETGPLGYGPRTGRGLGPCGLGLRRGFYGLGLRRRVWTEKDELAALEEEEKILEEELKAVREEKQTLKTKK